MAEQRAFAGPLSNNDGVLRFGGYNVMATRPMRGALDEVDLFNRALTGAEVLSIFAAGTDGKFIPGISGTKFNDLNGDGIQDAGEPGLENWTVYLDDNNSGALDVGEISAISDANGEYVLTGVAPGQHNVRAVPQIGWEQVSPGLFGVSASFATGARPASIISADLDGDGDSDLAMANQDSSNVSVLLNDGAGSFVAGSSPGIGLAPLGLSAGDLDGDGDVDLVAVNRNSNSISVLLNDGSASFAPAINVAVGPNPHVAEIVDLDGDGDLDVVVGNVNDNTLSLLSNDGAGSLSLLGTITVGASPFDIAASDVDADGDMDLAVANRDSDTVTVLYNQGAGTFNATLLTVQDLPESVAFADVDSDGNIDLIAANQTSGTISVFTNQGNGTFLDASHFDAGVGPRSLAVVDFDHDGDVDLAVANLFTANVSLLKNDGNGTFAAPTTVSAVASGYALVADDLNGNGWADLAVVNLFHNNVTVVPNTGGAQGVSVTANTITANINFGSTRTLGDITGTKFNDLNANGVQDVGEPGLEGWTIYLDENNNGTLDVGETSTLTDASGDYAFYGLSPDDHIVREVPQAGWVQTAPIVDFEITQDLGTGGAALADVQAGDFDGDGDQDLAVANAFSDTVSILLNDGTGTYAVHATLTAGASDLPVEITVADLDADNDLDLTVANFDSDRVIIFKNDGNAGFTSFSAVVTGDGPQDIGVGDLDGDGDLDLAVPNWYDSTVSVLLNNGDTTFATRVNYPVGSFPHGITVADLDGDGDKDLAVTSNVTSGTVTVLLNDGVGIFTQTVTLPVGNNPNELEAGDLDGDGDMDLVVSNNAANGISVLLNYGNATFAGTVDYAAGSNSNGIDFADFDGDGDLDVVTSDITAQVTLLLNDSHGSFNAAQNFAVGSEPRAIIAADIDGDGAQDLAVVDRSTWRAYILLNRFGQHPVTLSAGQTITNLDFGNVFKSAAYPSDLISLWPGQDSATDVISGNDGTLANGATFGPGIAGQAFSMDGSDDFVSGSLTNFAGGDSPITVAAWFNQDGAVGHPGKGILGVGNTGTNSHFFLRTAARGSDSIWNGGDGQNRLWIGVDDGGYDKWWASNAVIDPSEWYHAAATYSPGTREVKLYLNGALDRTIALSSGLTLSTDFWIGGDAYSDNSFNGRVDEPQVYGRNLSGAEVASVYSSTLGSPTVASLNAGPDPVSQGADLTLTATGVADSDGTVASVNFYWDINANGSVDVGTDVLFGTDTDGSDGWIVTSAVTGIPAGSQTFLAQAEDNTSLLSNVVSSSIQVDTAVYWDGDAGDLQWTNPLNWSGDILPQPGDEVVINVVGDITVVHSSGTTTVASLLSEESLSVTGGSLTVTDDSVVNGTLLLGVNVSLAANGPNAEFLATGAVTIDGASILASGGGYISLPTLNEYVQMGATSSLTASGSGSLVDLSALTTITGPTEHNRFLNIQSLAGGMVDLPALTQISVPIGINFHPRGVIVRADGASSVVSMPVLTDFIDDGASSGSRIEVSDSGAVTAPSLTDIVGVSLFANDGLTLSLPALESYDTGRSIGGGQAWYIQADGEDSVVDLPVLTTIIGPTDHNRFLNIQSLDGGAVELPTLTQINVPLGINPLPRGVSVRSDGPDSIVSVPLLTDFIDAGASSGSRIKVSNFGEVTANSLARIVGVSLYANVGLTFTLPALSSYDTGRGVMGGHSWFIRADGAGSVINLPNLNSITGPTDHNTFLNIQAMSGGTVDLNGLTQVNVSVGTNYLSRGVKVLADGVNSVVSMPALTGFNDNSVAPGSQLEARSNGRIDLSSTGSTMINVDVIAGADGEITVGTLTVATGSELTGTGTISGSVKNSNLVRPGSTLGTITITDDYEQLPGGQLDLQIGGNAISQYDRLVVGGRASLDGALNVSLVNGFMPTSSDAFQILQFDSRFCDFLTKTGVDLGGGLHLSAAFDLTSMTLNAGTTPDSGQQCQTIPVLTNIDVGPDPAKANDALSITFEVDVALSGTPVVTVAGNSASLANQSGPLYTFTYTVAGTESEGFVDVVMTATSLDGGVGVETVSTEFDFTAPVITAIAPSHEPADVGTALTVTFHASEALSNSTEVLIGGQAATRINQTTYTRQLTGDEGLGQVTVEVAAVDLAGNTSTTTGQVLIVSGGFDVNVTGIELSEDHPSVGQTVTATSLIYNSGFYDAINVPVRLALVEPNGDEIVLSDTIVPLIAAGSSAAVTTNIDLTTSGVHVVRLHVDPDNVIPEITELDNIATRSLIVDSAVTTVMGVAGSLSETTVDPGTEMTASGSATWLAGLNPAGAVAGGLVTLSVSGTFISGTALTNSNGDFTLMFDSPAIPGNYVANVVVSDVTTESPLALPFTVTAPAGGIDFFTTNSLVGASDFTPVINSAVTLSARVYNVGGDDFSGATNVRFYDGATLISTQVITGLTSQTSTVVSFSHTFTNAGPHVITAIVDEDNLTLENRESNNSGTRSIVVLDNVPDLSPIDILFSDTTPATTDTVTLTARVLNYGGAAASSVVVRFSDNGNPLGAAVIPSIAADGGTEFVSIQAVLPVAGVRDVSVVIDPDNDIIETDETNNIRVESIVVHDPAADLAASGIILSNITPVAGETFDVSMTINNVVN